MTSRLEEPAKIEDWSPLCSITSPHTMVYSDDVDDHEQMRQFGQTYDCLSPSREERYLDKFQSGSVEETVAMNKENMKPNLKHIQLKKFENEDRDIRFSFTDEASITSKRTTEQSCSLDQTKLSDLRGAPCSLFGQDENESNSEDSQPKHDKMDGIEFCELSQNDISRSINTNEGTSFSDVHRLKAVSQVGHASAELNCPHCFEKGKTLCLRENGTFAWLFAGAFCLFG